nr:hypothetical protein [uncultured Rhodopila sp.]
MFAYLAPDSFYQQFRAYNAITDAQFFMVWLGILCFSLGSWVGEMVPPGGPPGIPVLMDERVHRALVITLGAMATAATAIYLAPFVTNPKLALEIFSAQAGASETARRAVNQIIGITSQENLFMLVIVLIMVKPQLTNRPRTKGEAIGLAFIFTLTLFKAIVHGERLAVIELAVPFAVLLSAQRPRSAFWVWAPVFGTAGLLVFFAATEYLRSWVNYYAATESSIWSFAAARMFGYYITAFNNGAVIYSQEHSVFFPIFTIGWFWQLPIPGLAEHLRFLTGATNDYYDMLAPVNVEFNNISGMFCPFIDFGPVLGEFVWLAFGFASGRLYSLFMAGRPLGIILFPTWYIGVMEVPRVFYWGGSRYLPPLAASLAIVISLYIFARTSARTNTFARAAYKK